MPSMVLGAVGTFAVAVMLACGFLWLRCRTIGPPFGPRARYWSLFIVLATALVSTGAGLLIGAASHHDHAAFVGIIVPGGLWLRKMPPQRDRDMLPRTMTGLLTLPFSRLYDAMGDDMQDWCDIRLTAASVEPKWISDAAKYYYTQVAPRLRGKKALSDLERWRDSIIWKIDIERKIDSGVNPALVWATLQAHPATQHLRGPNDEDLPRLARRLETEALNELSLFLGYAYRLGYHKLLIFPFRPSVHLAIVKRVEPTAPEL
jgi:hypothetical protein